MMMMIMISHLYKFLLSIAKMSPRFFFLFLLGKFRSPKLILFIILKGGTWAYVLI